MVTPPNAGSGSSIGCASDWYSGGRGFAPKVPRHSFVEIGHEMSQLMRLCYLSRRRPAKAQAVLRIRAVSPEPSLFAHMKYGSKRLRVRPKIRQWIAAQVRLKNEFTEDEKSHNLVSWLKSLLRVFFPYR